MATETTFFAYAEGFSLVNSLCFMWLLLSHLEFFGVVVEDFHDRIEDEFYDIERFSNGQDFLNKAYTFPLGFNLERLNLVFKKTPWQMVQGSGIDNPNFLNFPNVVLDVLEIDAYCMLLNENPFCLSVLNLCPLYIVGLQKVNQVDTMCPNDLNHQFSND